MSSHAERTNGIRIHPSEQKVVPIGEELVLKYKLYCRDVFVFRWTGIILFTSFITWNFLHIYSMFSKANNVHGKNQ